MLNSIMKWIIFLFIFSLNKNTISTITRQNNSSDELLKHEIVPMKERHEDDFELDGNSHGNEKIKIFVGTFNVNGKIPSSKDDLLEWLKIDSNPHLVVIGLQEVVPLHDLGNYVPSKIANHLPWFKFKTERNENLERWRNMFHEHLGKANYEILDSKTMHAIHLEIFIKKDNNSLSNPIKKTNFSGTIKTGFLNLFANKGAVAISLMLNGASVCFVNSHLTSGRGKDKQERRNENYKKILRMKLSNGEALLDRTILKHNLVVWLGDLNYRLETKEDMNAIINKIESNNEENQNLNSIFEQYDQLLIAQKGAAAFVGFNEMRPNFKPTYSYQPGSNNWNKDKPEMPAWCDRILYRVNCVKGIEVTQLKYGSANKPDISDHKPVFAEFEIAVTKNFREIRSEEIVTRRESIFDFVKRGITHLKKRRNY